MAAFGLGRFGAMFSGSWVKPQTPDPVETRLQQQSLTVFNKDDGSTVIDTTHYFSNALQVENNFQNAAAIINEYRAMAIDADVDAAVDDIVNAAIVVDSDDEPLSINLEDVELSESVKNKIRDEFDNILFMMDFENTAYEKFRRWYVDGRQYYQVVVDDANPKKGIQKIAELDARSIKRVKEVKKAMDPKTKVETITGVEEYYVYNPVWANDNTLGSAQAPSVTSQVQSRVVGQTLKLPVQMVVDVNSGIQSPDGSVIFSHLEKARKPLNNLKMMRDAIVIYRITRAPERRLFYVDVGSLPKKTAEEYVQSMIQKHKSKMSYDPVSGKVNGHAYQQSMLEDFWLPRREGGRGTEVSTLAGGQNLGDIEDVLYFQRILFRSLNVPIGRLENDDGGSILLGGRGAEITRDEWKFNKFIQRLRRRYSTVFKDILKTQLVLKGICSDDEWEEIIAPHLNFEYGSDSYVKDQQDAETLLNTLNALGQADAFVGKYFSAEWVKRNIMKQTDEQIEQEQERMDAEQEIADKRDAEQAAANSELELDNKAAGNQIDLDRQQKELEMQSKFNNSTQ